MSAISQPAWHAPAKQELPALKIMNSLTRKKEVFHTIEPNHVKWYICGPTVYNKSHLGHARTYIGFDIIRRVMTNYFGYDATFVMNITDIDDKIILSARKEHLVKEYRQKHHTSAQFVADVKAALDAFLQSKFAKYGYVQGNWESILKKFHDGGLPTEEDPKLGLYVKTSTDCLEAIEKVGVWTEDELYSKSHDVLAAYLDTKFGDTVTDSAIYKNFAQYWENDYFKDMEALNVLEPDILTRVSEYVPEIVDYVAKIVSNGYAYEADGSVYFDTRKFHEDQVYAKLAPWNANNLKLMEEGEGDLSAGDANKKRHPSDFALWKKSKGGEPFWDSPWGQGRPGWHIECSVMASHILGEQMDIHGGGIDLTFPHHDNELAQSEAYFGCKQWVNYFMHTGHLHIAGLKMSKSLKNFLSIRETLEQVTASQLRIMFLMHQWDSVLDYSDGAIETAKNYEAFVKNFFAMTDSIVREGDGKSVEKNVHNHGIHERTLLKELGDARIKVRERLSDSFDTPSAMLVLKQLISTANTYVAEKRKLGEPVNHRPLRMVKSYVEQMFQIFGVLQGSTANTKNDDLVGLAQTVSTFRDSVRRIAQEKKDKEVLNLCDELRDVGLVQHGVVVEDISNGPAVVKVVEKEWAMQQAREKQEKVLLAQKKKEEARRLEAAKEAEKWEKAKVKPLDLFKTEEFEEWDDRGIPTKLKGGEEVTKSKKKKYEKEYEKQVKLHQEYLQKFPGAQ